MAHIRFLPSDRTIDIEKGATILDAARRLEVEIESPCNGTGTCGKCKVVLNAGETSVLACRTEIAGDATVTISPSDRSRDLKILSEGVHAGIGRNPHIRKTFVSEDNTTYVYAEKYLLGAEKGDTTGRLYGIVVDIGTTTLVLSLVDLVDGREIDTISSLNPQAIRAQDVLSRISFSSDPGGLDLLFGDITGELNGLLTRLARKAGVDRENIYEAVYSGNTCMLHLACKVDPHGLGRYPYIPALAGNQILSAEEHGLNISRYGIIYLPPIISGFVGADITSGLLAVRLHEKKGVTLFVDIGTNGEMVLGMDGRLIASSTAAGPAFEGMNITFGMRAGYGAVEQFRVDDGQGISMKTIGGSEVTGICGSGLLDMVGELVAYGAIDERGRFAKPQQNGIVPFLKERLGTDKGKPVFYIGDNVYLSQKDVRQVQLAKGAIRTGIEFLLRHAGIAASHVDEILIAGSFGYHLREESLINTGLLPASFKGKINFVGNTSKSGGHAFLMDKDSREEIQRIVKGVEVIELANYKDFDRVFIESMGFGQP